MCQKGKNAINYGFNSDFCDEASKIDGGKLFIV
jgi:hypothetical protein